ncbi:hypothetical protein ACFVVC_01665 [Pseudarthrobacter sp. NPDC058196]|uniref:hypothetical protein n=1 Tax=Pseudarthrobacter sp. NPDC058196 TaxID=3346376 RepID=UPI0036DFA3FE
MFARLGFSAIPLLVFVAATHVEMNFWLTMVIFLAVSFAIQRIQGHVRRRSIGADGADVSIAAASVLWDDVVDATFINILEAKGIAVDPASQRAATAGWVHLARTADSVQQLIAGK